MKRIALVLLSLAVSQEVTTLAETQLNATTGGCVGKAPGVYPPWTMTRDGYPWAPYPPYCPSSYIECGGDGTGAWVQDGLGQLPLPGGTDAVPAVFNWISSKASLPGAIGSRGCECEKAYGKGNPLETACQACSALQYSGLCDHRRAVADPSFACTAPFPGSRSQHIKCTLEGPSVEEGGLQGVSEEVQDLIDVEFGIKQPSKRFAVMVNQDLGDPMLEQLLKEGADEDQYMRLVRQGELGQHWTYYHMFQTDRFPDGELPSDEELGQLDGFILSGDKLSLPDRITDRVLGMIRRAAGQGKRIMGTCYGNGQITQAFNGTYLSMAQYNDPTLDKLEFGAVNVTVSPAARAAVNASWADLIPDSFVVNTMHDNAVYGLPPGAIHLGWSQRTPVEMFVVGPFNNVLAFQGHPEANRNVTEIFAKGAPAQAEAGIAECMARLPPAQAAKLCPAWKIKWVLDSVGRMDASYRQYSGEESREALTQVVRAFLNA